MQRAYILDISSGQNKIGALWSPETACLSTVGFGVESTTGAVAIGVTSLLPRLSVRGAPLATP
jgi:hypothetical protein